MITQPTSNGEQPGSAEKPAQEILSIKTAYTSLKESQRNIGLERIRMGALLCLLELSETWRGRTGGNSFRRFLIEEGIEPKAACQYMKVAQVFVLRLRIPKTELWKICHASMRVLTEAARVINEDNLEDVIDIVATLPRPEALEALGEFGNSIPQKPEKVQISRPVGTILDKVGDLTFVQKAELYAKLGMTKNVFL